MAKTHEVGSPVSWAWGNGRGTGTVLQVHTRRVTRSLRGSDITRNGTGDCPAYLIETDDGSQVLKLHSEVEAT